LTAAHAHHVSYSEEFLLKIANWNLERVLPSQRRVQAISEHIARIGADVWILTETNEAMSPGKGFEPVLSGEPDRPSTPGERWVAIWSRHPIEPLSSLVSDPVRCAAARLVHPQLGEVVVFACVLPWGGSSWRGISWMDGAFSAALELYSGDWLRARTAFPDAVFIAAGDFNQDLARRHYYGSKARRLLLESALASTGLRPLTAGEDDPIARDSRGYACIDHICVSSEPAIRVGRATRWPEAPAPVRELSDHFGVAVDVGPA
jgi:endonuclease/exonuclease/phosphatase family metal-dependent hydrolase